jgi:hypothetical protein
MLILLLRVVFVTLATLIGLTSGSTIYNAALDGSLPGWFGGAMGFGIAITLVACEHAFRRRFTRSLVAFLIGLGAGLALSALLLLVLRQVIQDENIINNLDLPLALITSYLVLVIVLRNVDNFRMVIPFVEFRAERADAGAVILDGQVLGDGRLIALVNSGLLPRRWWTESGQAHRAGAVGAGRSALVRGDPTPGQEASQWRQRVVRDLAGPHEIPQGDEDLGVVRTRCCRPELPPEAGAHLAEGSTERVVDRSLGCRRPFPTGCEER